MKCIEILVPIHNEYQSLPLFVSCIQKTVIQHHPEYEWTLLFIDDGSTDESFELIKSLSEEIKVIRFIKLTRNFGKEAAIAAGLAASQGDALVVIDVDMQDPPHLINEMITKWENGAISVVAVRENRDKDSFLKKKIAQAFYKTFNLLTDDVKIPFNAGDFRLMDRKLITVLKKLDESTRFSKGLFAWAGYKDEYVYFSRNKRANGRSSFNITKLLKLATNGILSFSTKPLKLWTYLGLLSVFISGFLGARIAYLNLVSNRDAPGLVTIIFAIFLTSGTQMIGIGLLGQYVARIFQETKHRPLYVVERTNLSHEF